MKIFTFFVFSGLLLAQKPELKTRSLSKAEILAIESLADKYAKLDKEKTDLIEEVCSSLGLTTQNCSINPTTKQVQEVKIEAKPLANDKK